MDGVHDLGGKHGFGAIEREENEPPFHAAWEPHVIAMQQMTRSAGVINIDEFRHGIERMNPAHYLASSYFEHWLDGIARVLVEKGVITDKDLDARTEFFGRHPEMPAQAAIEGSISEPPVSQRPGPPDYRREAAKPPLFHSGDAVMTKIMHPRGHTRLAQYARGRRGVIDQCRGVYVFPDTNAHGQGEQPQPLYSVVFEAQELWGDDAEPSQRIYIDLWEDYLKPR